MGWLDEYKKEKDRLSDVLPWHCLISPAVLVTKDGGLMATIEYRGMDVGSASKPELMRMVAQVNHVIKQFEGGWTLFFEAKRVKCRPYPRRYFPDQVTQDIEDERRAAMNAGNFYESRYYFTLHYLPPPDTVHTASEWFLIREERQTAKGADAYARHVQDFESRVSTVYALIKDVFKSIRLLKRGEFLSYLHSCISARPTLQVADPEINGAIPVHLDVVLADSPLVSGYELKLGDLHLRIISIKSFPVSSVPCYLDALNTLDIEYRWCSRFICLDKRDALAELRTYRKKYFSARTTIASYLRELTSGGRETGLENSEADMKFEETREALKAVEADFASEGYYTMTVIVADRDAEEVKAKAKLIEKTINRLGFTTYDEKVNALEAWLGSVPGNVAFNPRRPLYYSLGLCHLLPLSANWAGQERNDHLRDYPLLYTKTSGSTPFRVSLHYGDVGHTLIIGPTGAGKSTLLGLIAAQFRTYKDAQVFIFDVDCSCKALTLGAGGDFYDAASSAFSYQPLKGIDKEDELTWAHEWIVSILEADNIDGGKAAVDTKKAVKDALTALAGAPVKQRTMTGLMINLQNVGLRTALLPYTVQGLYGKLLDSPSDNLSASNWQAFEMGRLIKMDAVCPHVLCYLFHRLESRLTGAPTLIIVDEFWRFLASKMFSKYIELWLRTFRKKNASVVFATQGLSEVAAHPLFQTIVDSCATKIFLPNVNAADEQFEKLYATCQLTKTELELIAKAAPKREYYFKNPLGSRLFDLALGRRALAWVGSSSPEDLAAAEKILADHGQENFRHWWYRFKGID